MSMKQRNNPTLAEHIELARRIHAAEDALSELFDCSRFFYARETDSLIRARERYLSRLKCRLEDTMFADYPHLSNDWLRLYYGDGADVDRLAASVEQNEQRRK